MDYVMLHVYCLLAFSILWLQLDSQFVKQPGDVALTAIPGYPLSEAIPCVLEMNDCSSVEWEEHSTSASPRTISGNQAIVEQYKQLYQLKKGDPHDCSIRMKKAPSNHSQLRCYFLDTDMAITLSTWSNITYTAPPSDAFPKCKLLTNNDKLEEGENIVIICKSKGAVPTATLKLFNGTSHLLLAEDQQETGIVFTTNASRYDHEKPFYCTAENEATRILGKTPNCSVQFQVRYKPHMARFEMDPKDNRNCTIWCKVDSNPSSNITLFNMSDENPRIIKTRSGVTDLKYSILSAMCLSGVKLKCLAENEIGQTDKLLSPHHCCVIGLSNTGVLILSSVSFATLFLTCIVLLAIICHCCQQRRIRKEDSGLFVRFYQSRPVSQDYPTEIATETLEPVGSRGSDCPDVIQTGRSGSHAPAPPPPPRPLKPRVARKHGTSEERDDLYEPVEVRQQWNPNEPVAGTGATPKKPIVYAELDFDKNEAASATSPVIHCKEEASFYAEIKMD